MNLTKKTTSGIIWNISDQLGRQGIQAIVTLVLALFLTPEDFGLVAMMTVFLTIATSLMDSGFKQALIQLKNANNKDFNTAFYANLTLGLLSYIFLFLAAPFIADFYNEVRLVNLIRVSGLAIIISSFQVVQSATLSRNLNFKAQLKASIPANLISGIVAITLAYFKFGVWALMAQFLFGSLVNTVLLWQFQGWRPRLIFCGKSLGKMYSFGYKLFLSGLLDTLYKNIYIIVIAKVFTATTAGLYFFSDKIADLLIKQMITSIQNVTYPALATIQDDNERLKAGYRKILSVTTFLIFPVIALVAALAAPLFELFLPNKWQPAVPYLQLMCFSGILYPLHSINLNILKVKGRSDLFLYLEIIKKIMFFLILLGTYRFGVNGIIVGQIIGSALAYLPNSYFSTKLVNYSAREQISDFLPSLLISSFIGGVVYTISTLLDWHPVVKVGVFGVFSASMYLFCAHLLNVQSFRLVFDIAAKYINKAKAQAHA